MDIIPKSSGSVENGQENEKNMNDDGGDMDGIDRISSLPTDVLCHILSFLPTKDAAGTSILSTRFQNLLPLVLNLRIGLFDTHLIHPESPSENYLMNFQSFVYRLLNVTLRDVPSIHSFRLFCQKFDDGRVMADWITTALRLNIEIMDIRTNQLKNVTFLVDSLFGSNLVSLNLLLDFSEEEVPELKFSFPNLKELVVHCMDFIHVNVLLACSPRLEALKVDNCYGFAGDKLQISVPSLKALELVNGFDWVVNHIEIDAPGLLNLAHSGHLAIRYSVKKMKFLKVARLYLKENLSQYPFESDEEAAELINACSDVEKLWLSGKFVTMLSFHPYPLPKFRKLIDLVVEDLDVRGWKLLPRMVLRAPKLKNLYLRGGVTRERYTTFRDSFKDPISPRMYRVVDDFLHVVIRRMRKPITPAVIS